ncbi:MAG TPA: type II toxin-antitoxin system Phd/YefM family antitoxin, partial [Candidatus Competibacteraceae bacterium]|nr:type II toxin-antitoxin system Phd/YefM family antitoxin [Candidatus Competibacteraceae bacterium]
LSHQEFKRDANKAQQAAQHGPVFITDHGRPAHVLLTIQEYQRLTAYKTNIVEWLAMPDNADWEFEPPRLRDPLYQPADLS